MAKIVLGAKPKNFKPFTVKVELPDGTEGSIEMIYKYRSRSEFGAFVDETIAKVRAGIADEPEAPAKARKGKAAAKATDAGAPEALEFSYERLHAGTSKANADYILSIADGWNLEAEFTHANIQQLADEAPGLAQAVMDAYRAACTEGRLGN